jgi:hypothetical protein
LQKLASLVLVALMVGLAFVPVGEKRASAQGFGATCLNRHDASIRYVLIYGSHDQGALASVNYTGSGDVLDVQSYYGYTVDVYLSISPWIMLNPQPDTTNGTVFVHTNDYGFVTNYCIPNIGLTQTALVVEAHIANLTGLQTVTWSTGTHSGQYNVSWIGP